MHEEEFVLLPALFHLKPQVILQLDDMVRINLAFPLASTHQKFILIFCFNYLIIR